MRHTLVILVLLGLCSWASAQVEIDNSIDFNSTIASERQVQGLASPVDGTNLISMGATVSGTVNWCSITRTADTLILQPVFEPNLRLNGQLFRFLMDANSTGDTWIGSPGFSTARLLDGDGSLITEGMLRQGETIQVQWKDSVYYLLNPPPSICPTGFIRINETLCIQSSDNTLVDWYEANEICDEKGGRLCTWGEYIHACQSHGPQMTGLFNNWEWMDDSSDHTHTADQVGRWACHSNRSKGATHQEFANFRCCYLLR